MREFRRDDGDFKPRRRESEFKNEDFDRDKPSRKYRVTCDKCGKDCEVPFKPTGSKPVLCSDCFRKAERYGPRSDSFESRREPRASPSVDLREVNEKLDKIMKALNID